ncbi:hypothetical protein PAXRUDRAFT_27159 [Paxillus rubicundulus Ve08.2h10]|uniref:Uncharacterized protein n=1 Tax=Paxillus rubicundulus Ve08.2h10 TaxID=930991 RepID=A0A0D0DJ75_9AGAM|nr:hypothetical protein PAXRUDRAFT_27159 [Paxillus rubicundulus Ve08.2h10]
MWSRQPVDNPYGSDIIASGPVGDDEEEGEDEVPELEQGFSPWNDEDAPDGKQTGVRSRGKPRHQGQWPASLVYANLAEKQLSPCPWQAYFTSRGASCGCPTF